MVTLTVPVIPLYKPVPASKVTGAVPETTAEQVFMLLMVGWALAIFVLSAVLLTSNVPRWSVTLA
jgi:hypothetical protein